MIRHWRPQQAVCLQFMANSRRTPDCNKRSRKMQTESVRVTLITYSVHRLPALPLWYFHLACRMR